jgi:hypothetical protein
MAGVSDPLNARIFGDCKNMNEPTKAQLICDARKLRDDIEKFFNESHPKGPNPDPDGGLADVLESLEYFLAVNPPVKENLTTDNPNHFSDQVV